MCNAYEHHVRWVEYSQMMQDLELEIPTQKTELDLPQSDLVRINDIEPVMSATGQWGRAGADEFQLCAQMGPKAARL